MQRYPVSRSRQMFRAHHRLFTATAVGIVLGLLLPGTWRAATRVILGWDTGILLPNFDHDPPQRGLKLESPSVIYKAGAPNMSSSVVKEIQRALSEAGFDPGPIDGVFGHNTTAAVSAFQATMAWLRTAKSANRRRQSLSRTLPGFENKALI